jgi:hypothetical protein
VNLRPRSKVLSTLEQVFIKDLSVLWSVHLSLPLKIIPTALCCHHHASPYCRDGASDGIQVK